MENETPKYKTKLHIATGPFSFFELEIEDTSVKILKVNDWLLKHYENKQK